MSADDACVFECVFAAFGPFDDVVYFCAVWSARVFPVELFPAEWAVCDAVVEVDLPALVPDLLPRCGGCAVGCHGLPCCVGRVVVGLALALHVYWCAGLQRGPCRAVPYVRPGLGPGISWAPV